MVMWNLVLILSQEDKYCMKFHLLYYFIILCTVESSIQGILHPYSFHFAHEYQILLLGRVKDDFLSKEVTIFYFGNPELQ